MSTFTKLFCYQFLFHLLRGAITFSPFLIRIILQVLVHITLEEKKVSSNFADAISNPYHFLSICQSNSILPLLWLRIDNIFSGADIIPESLMGSSGPNPKPGIPDPGLANRSISILSSGCRSNASR